MKRYWKIAPGREAMLWDRCKQDKNIAVGWDEGFGDYDLSILINDQNKFEKIYEEKYRNIHGAQPRGIHEAQLKRQKDQLWNFLHLNIGDVVLANRGMRSIVGTGRVTGGYQYRSEYSQYKHTVAVDWFDTEEKEIPPQAKEIIKDWWSLTLKELSESDYQLLINKNTEVILRPNNDTVLLLMNKKKQIILYGPPGTGKTYHTKNLALALIENPVTGLGGPRGLPPTDIQNPPESPTTENIFFNTLNEYVKKLLNIKAVPQKSMIGYYSISKKINKNIGLVWIGYPIDKHSSFAVHLRKDISAARYSAELTSKLANYNENGWGGYPEFRIKSQNDIDVTIKLINFAYENL